MGKIVIPGPRLSVPYLDAPPVASNAPAYEQLASDINRGAAALDEKFRADAAVNVAQKMASTRAQFSERLQTAYQNGEIDDSFTAVVDSEFDKVAGDLMNGAQGNQYEANALSAGLMALQAEVREKARGQAAAAATARRVSAGEAAFNEWAGTVFADPSQYEAVRGEAEAFAKGFIGPQDAKLKFEKMLQGIGESALRGMAERNPAQAIKAIDSGSMPYQVDADRLPAIRNHAQGELTRRTNEAEQAQAKAQTTATLAFKLETDKWAAGLRKTRPELTPEVKAQVGVDNALRLESDLIGTEAARTKAYADVQAVQQRFAAGLAIDEKDPQQKRGLDQHYRENFAPALADLAPQDRTKQQVAFAVTFGAVPETLKSEIRAGLRASSDDLVLEAANMVAALKQENPRLLDGMAKEDLDLATRILSHTDLGVAPKKALEAVREAERVPEPVRAVRAQEFKALTSDEDADAALRNVTGGESSWGALLAGEWKTAADVPASAREEFKRLRRDEFMRSGDLGAADVYARETMKRTWGLSMMTGRPTVTKWAPERWYGSPQLSSSENWEWISGQAAADLKKATGSLPEGTMLLQPHPSRKAPDGRPAYQVIIQKPNGLYDVPKGKDGRPVVFIPDLNKVEAGAKVKAKQAEKLRRAREANDFKKRQSELPLGLGL